MAAITVVYRRPANALLGLIAFAALATLYLWSSQVLVISTRHLAFDNQPGFVAAALVLAALFGLLLPLEVYAARIAAARATQAGGTLLGALAGTASMTCCAPVLLPSLLSLLGFSGTTLLNLNVTLDRYWLPLATLSAILLLYSLFSVVHSLQAVCRLDGGTPDVQIG